MLDELLLDFLLRKIEEKAEVMEFFVARLASLPAKKMKKLPDFCLFLLLTYSKILCLSLRNLNEISIKVREMEEISHVCIFRKKDTVVL